MKRNRKNNNDHVHQFRGGFLKAVSMTKFVQNEDDG